MGVVGIVGEDKNRCPKQVSKQVSSPVGGRGGGDIFMGAINQSFLT